MTVIKESRIAGIFEAVSTVYTDDKKIFKVPIGLGNETFPLRIKVKQVQIFKKPVEFKPLIPKLKFIRFTTQVMFTARQATL